MAQLEANSGLVMVILASQFVVVDYASNLSLTPTATFCCGNMKVWLVWLIM